MTDMTADPVSIDDALRHAGEFGAYQWKVYLMVAGVWVPTSLPIMIMSFVDLEPATTPELETVCDDGLGAGQFSYDEPSHTIAAEWDLVCDREYLVSTAGALFFLGFLLGATTFGMLADRRGRRKVMFLALGVAGVFGLLSAAAQSVGAYMALRLLCGVGVGGSGLLAFVLSTEFIGLTYRSVAGVMVQGFFAAGVMLLAGVASVLPGWRALTVFTSLTCLAYLAAYPFVPESPRWLLVQGRVEEAHAALAAVARGNGRVLPAGLQLRADARPAAAAPASPLDLLRPELRTTTAVMLFAWFVVSFAYYGLSLASGELGGSIYLDVFLAGLVEIPAYVSAVWLLERAGRRASTVGYFALGGACCVVVALIAVPDDCDDDDASCGAKSARTAFALVGKFAVAAAFAALYLYASEVFPTVIRSLGIGYSSLAARIGGMVAPFVVFLDSAFWCFGLASLAAAALCTRLPETLGRRLPDTLEDIRSSSKSSGGFVDMGSGVGPTGVVVPGGGPAGLGGPRGGEDERL